MDELITNMPAWLVQDYYCRIARNDRDEIRIAELLEQRDRIAEEKRQALTNAAVLAADLRAARIAFGVLAFFELLGLYWLGHGGLRG